MVLVVPRSWRRHGRCGAAVVVVPRSWWSHDRPRIMTAVLLVPLMLQDRVRPLVSTDTMVAIGFFCSDDVTCSLVVGLPLVSHALPATSIDLRNVMASTCFFSSAIWCHWFFAIGVSVSADSFLLSFIVVFFSNDAMSSNGTVISTVDAGDLNGASGTHGVATCTHWFTGQVF